MSNVTRLAIWIGVTLAIFVALIQMGPGLLLVGIIGLLLAVLFPSLSQGGVLALGFIMTYVIIFLVAIVLPPIKRGC